MTFVKSTASARLDALADELCLDLPRNRAADWIRERGYDGAVQHMHDLAAVRAALHRRGLPCAVMNAGKRLRYGDAATIVAMLDAGETNTGHARQIQLEAERHGFTLHESTAHAWLRALDYDGTCARIRDIRKVLDHGDRCGLGLTQQQAMKQLEQVGYDADAAIERVDLIAAEHRWLAERQLQPCRSHGRPADDNARAACACRGCFGDLYLRLERYGRVVCRDHNSSLVRRFGVDELHADHAAPALCHAVFLWQHGYAEQRDGDFTAFYGGVLKNAMRDTAQHWMRLRRCEIPQSLDEPLFEDGVSIADRIPDRSIDVQRIVIERAGIFAKIAAARARRLEAVERYQLATA